MKIEYEGGWSPQGDTLAIVRQADEIATEYAAGGYGLTLRQLYYQFVSRDLLANSDKSYKKLGNIVSRARLEGLLDWSHLTDRTRNPTLPYVGEPTPIHDAIRQARYFHSTDKWATQDLRVEVWVEKEALGEVVQRAASSLACGSLACKGYMSQSEMWEAGQRFSGYLAEQQRVVILHLGDHDPSGIDMTRDIRDRLSTFIGGNYAHEHHGMAPADLGWEDYTTGSWSRGDVLDDMRDQLDFDDDVFTVERIALNWDQIQEYGPPPNPAKLSDSRGADYVERFGYESWELDALPPDVLNELIRSKISELMDQDAYNAQHDLQQRGRDAIDEIADRLLEGE